MNIDNLYSVRCICTKESAIAKAKEMRVAKIKAVRKQLANLEAMTFEP